MREITLNPPYFLHGGDYNPEQWKRDKSVWDEDMRLMQKAHCNTATIGMFSWSEIEKSEGEFDFSVFDEIIARIEKNGGKVILSTPSGARPRWLAEKYPEVLRMEENGLKRAFGSRQNHCYTSPAYRERVRIINEELSKRYGKHPAVIGWHISNEYGGACYCRLCRAAFKKFVQKRYKTIENLNEQYWAAFWSHTYTSFDQIDPPGATGDTDMHALTLDWHRFVSAQTLDFMRAEIAAVRKYSDKPVTTNMMPGFYDLDYETFAPDLDFISWDNYPAWNSPRDFCAAFSAYWYDYFRCLKNRPTVLMETTPSKVNWAQVCKLKEPGMNRFAALQAIAHGSDGFLYFQWRQSRGASEKLHGAVVDSSGRDDTRVFREVSETGEILSRLSDSLIGMPPERARVAILFDWTNMWAFEGSQGFRYDKNYREENALFYKTMYEKNIACDVVSPRADLSGYDLVIAVQQYVTDEETIDNLERYVRGGGTLYATYITGIVNENDLRYLGGVPAGKLKDVFGILAEELDTMYPEQRRRVNVGGVEYEAEKYAESILLRGAQSLGAFTDGMFKGQPCMTVHSYGKGKAYYQAFANCAAGAGGNADRRNSSCETARQCGGENVSARDFKADMLGGILREIGISAHVLPAANESELPHGVFSRMRKGRDGDYLFVFNYAETPTCVRLDCAYINVLTGERVEKGGELHLEKNDSQVLKREA